MRCQLPAAQARGDRRRHHRAAWRDRRVRGAGAARGPVRRLAVRPRVRRHDVSLASLAGERLFFEGDNSSGGRRRPPQRHRSASLHDGGVPRDGRVRRLARGHRRRHRPAAGSRRRGRHRPPVPRDRVGPPGRGQPPALLDQVTASCWTTTGPHVLAVAHALETYKTISGEDVVAIIEGHVGSAGRRHARTTARRRRRRDRAATTRPWSVARKEQARVASASARPQRPRRVVERPPPRFPASCTRAPCPTAPATVGPARTRSAMPPPTGPPAWSTPPPAVLPERTAVAARAARSGAGTGAGPVAAAAFGSAASAGFGSRAAPPAPRLRRRSAARTAGAQRRPTPRRRPDRPEPPG